MSGMTESFVREHYFSEKQMAALMGISPKTLENRRGLGVKHPPVNDRVKIDGRPAYPKVEAIKWLSGGVTAARAS